MKNQQSVNQTKPSSCILCSINCGLQVKTGGKDAREIVKIKGDRDNPSSNGYLCSKANRLNYYQNSADRLNTPMRRKPNGTYEPVSWSIAIKEVASGLRLIKQRYGGEKILYIGGGGQGNHLGGIYGDGLQKALGIKFRTNSLAQEKTGEFWVNGKMFGGGPHGDFEHTEVAMFLGKNPWQTHGFPRSRVVLNAIARAPERSMIVVDPCLTDTAKMADFHLQLRPGTDAWALSAMVATVVQEGIEDKHFIEQHTQGYPEIRDHFATLSITEYCDICELDEALLRAATRRFATAKSASIFEDLGIQQNVNSTLVSYLQRILYVITGNFAKKGAANIGVSLLSVSDASKGDVGNTETGKKKQKVSPVLGSKIIIGLLPCNEVPDEILTDHPNRFRSAIIESSNPVHAYANSKRMREAISALEFSVVIDVAMTETAREASYVLPAASSYEKHECVFFQIDFPKNTFQLRHPIIPQLPGTLVEAEIHTRLIEQLGFIKPFHIKALTLAAKIGRRTFAIALMAMLKLNPELIKVIPSLLYRTLGKTLGDNNAATAVFWGLCHKFVQKNSQYAANAGFTGNTWQAGEELFKTLINSPSGFIFSDSGNDYNDSWKRVRRSNKRILLNIQELFPALTQLDTSMLACPSEFPLILTAGQRRTETANTIIRDISWDKKNKAASLFMHPEDAQALSLATGDNVKVITQAGSGETDLLVTENQRPGFISLPNGLGIEYVNERGKLTKVGISPNELTSSEQKDFFAGTPWHKYVPARVEKVSRY